MHMQRLAVVDGLRAIAIVAVVLFHLYPASLTGGFVGVDIFFAVSGFVIALRYLDALAASELSFRDFFARRVRRLLPAYMVVVIVTAALALAITRPKDLYNFGMPLAAQSVFLQNVAYWQADEYFNDALMKPLLHTWSLAVEVQFYLLFPLLVILLRWRPGWRTAMVVMILLASLVLGLVGTRASSTMTFFLLPFRAWEFMLGIAAALAYRRVSRLTPTFPVQLGANAAAVMGIFAMLVAITAFDEDAAFPGPQSLLALAGAVLVMLTQAHMAAPLYHAFSNRVVQHLGRISYSWYLWHWPIIALHYLHFWRDMTGLEKLAALALGYGLGVVSYLTVETWGPRSPWLRRPRNTIGLLLLFCGFCLSSGLAMVMTKGFLDRYSGREKALYAAQMSIPPYRCPIAARLKFDDSQFCQINTAPPGNGILLIGDSHADMMKPALSDMAQQAGRPLYFLIQNCRVGDFGRRRNCLARNWPRLLAQIGEAGIADVIIISRFVNKFDAARFDQAVGDITRQGVRVTISLPTPENPMFDPGYWISAGRADRWPEKLPISRAEAIASNAGLIAAMRETAGRYPQVRIVDSTARICPDNCRLGIDGNPLYQDEHHLTAFGAFYVSSLYRDVIVSR